MTDEHADQMGFVQTGNNCPLLPGELPATPFPVPLIPFQPEPPCDQYSAVSDRDPLTDSRLPDAN